MKNNEMNMVTETFEMLVGYVDQDGNVHREFEVREMNGLDEEAISKNSIKNNGGKILRTILERCCVRIGTIERSEVKPSKWTDIIQDLTVDDQDYILFKIRELSYGEEIECKHTCPNPECKEEIITTIETDELEVIPFDGQHTIEFELPKGFKDKDGNLLRRGKIRRPNGLDREILDNVIRKNVGQANTLMLSRCIVELEGIKVYDDLVRSLSVKDRNYLVKLIEEHKCGVNLAIDIECPNCYEEFKASLNAVNFI